MKRTFRIFQCGASKMRFATLFMICFLAAGPLSSGAPFRSAHVSQVIRDVRLLPTNTAPRPAAVNDNIVEGTAVRTGIESRAELTFADLTITRLGENTVFSFREAARELNISKGAVLVEVPSKAPAARINTAAVTAAVMGGTALFATGPPVKFMVLEGIGTFYPAGHPEQAVTVQAGEMVMLTASGQITQPTKFNVQLILETSRLIVDFPNLANLPLILQVMNQQLADQSAGTSNPPPSKNPLTGVIDVVTQNVTANPAVETFTATPTPPPTPTPSGTPSKFGPPSTITSPNPYVITSGTTITTDPSITTNGVTDFGKVWRGPSIDGPLSAFIFGSTSAFDTSSGFDTELNGQMGGAGFKFTALQLTGNPTIVTTNGEINLGLIAVDTITSGSPGGVLTFAGIRGLLLATQNGPINLGPEISFSGLHDVTFYARGTGSMLTLASDVSTTNKIRLYGEGGIQLAGNLSTQDLIAFTGGDFDFNSGSVTAQTLFVMAGANINIGVNTPVTINGSEASLLIPNSGTGNIAGNATITLQPAGNLTLNGANGLSLTIDNSNGGHIGQSAKILLDTADLTAGSLNLFVNNRNGGSIGSVANVACNILGNLTIAGDANIGTSNRNDGLGGGTMGTDSIVTVQANSISVGGFLSGFVSANAGGHIGNVASLQFNATGDIHSGGGTSFLVQGTAFNTPSGPPVAPGFIGSDALLNVSASNVSSDGFLDAEIGLSGGGHIGGNANLSFNIAGGIAAAGPTDLVGGMTFFVGGSAGTIGGDAAITVNAASIASQAFLFFAVSDPNGGTIGGNAAIDVTATNLSGNSLSARINNTGGSIGGNATISMNVSGTANVTTDATFEIFGSNGAAKGAAITFNGGNYGVGGTFLSTIDGDGTITFNNASLHADVVKVGVFGNSGTLTIGGGAISANTLLKLYAPGSNNGTLNFVANVTLSSGTAADFAANTITIQPSVIVTIGGNGGPANIFTNHPNYNFTPGPGYAGPPGNPSNGSFGGNGARDPKPLANAPPFNGPASSSAGIVGGGAQTSSSTNVTSSSSKVNGGLGGVRIRKGGEPAMPNRKTTGGTINVGSSAELLSLLDAAVPSLGGKITIPTPNRIHRSKNSNRNNVDGGLKANGGTVGARHVRDSTDNPRLLASARSF